MYIKATLYKNSLVLDFNYKINNNWLISMNEQQYLFYKTIRTVCRNIGFGILKKNLEIKNS